MSDMEIQIERDVHGLIVTLAELTKSSLDPYAMTFVCRNANDLELAYSQLGRLLNRARGYQRNAVVPMEAAE